MPANFYIACMQPLSLDRLKNLSLKKQIQMNPVLWEKAMPMVEILRKKTDVHSSVRAEICSGSFP
jgi:hypothetical protein